MIEIGKNFLWGLANAKQAARQERRLRRLPEAEAAAAAEAQL